jgi:hypothetical protein
MAETDVSAIASLRNLRVLRFRSGNLFYHRFRALLAKQQWFALETFECELSFPTDTDAALDNDTVEALNTLFYLPKLRFVCFDAFGQSGAAQHMKRPQTLQVAFTRW